MSEELSRLIRADDFKLDHTYDTLFEQLAKKIALVSDSSNINVFASCQRLYSEFYTSHYIDGGGALAQVSIASEEEFLKLKEKYESIEIQFSIHNSEILSFYIFHDGKPLKLQNSCRKVLRRLIEVTAYNKLQELRDQIVTASFEHEQLEDFYLQILIEIMPQFFKVEGASIFYEEEGSQNLVLGATTGIKHKFESSEISRLHVTYHPDDASCTYKSYKKNEPIFEIKPLRSVRFIEDVSLINNRLYLPITVRPVFAGRSSNKELLPNGVLRLVNYKRNAIDQIYSDVDYILLCHIGDYLSVLTNQYVNVMLLKREHDRATHGYNTDLASLGMLTERTNKSLDKLFDSLRLQILTFPNANNETIQALTNLQNSLKRIELEKDIRIRNLTAVHDSLSAQFLTAMLYNENSGGFIFTPTEHKTERPFVQVFHRLLDVSPHMKKSHKVNNFSLLFAGQPDFSDSYKRIPPVHLPPEYFYLVMRNLLENSIKYSDIDEKDPCVDIRWAAHSSQVLITFEDNGIGVPEGLATKIFKTGYRADNAIFRSSSGIGLGLSNCRHVVRLYDGELKYEGPSNNDTGSVFSLILKRA